MPSRCSAHCSPMLLHHVNQSTAPVSYLSSEPNPRALTSSTCDRSISVEEKLTLPRASLQMISPVGSVEQGLQRMGECNENLALIRPCLHHSHILLIVHAGGWVEDDPGNLAVQAIGPSRATSDRRKSGRRRDQSQNRRRQSLAQEHTSCCNGSCHRRQPACHHGQGVRPCCRLLPQTTCCIPKQPMPCSRAPISTHYLRRGCSKDR